MGTADCISSSFDSFLVPDLFHYWSQPSRTRGPSLANVIFHPDHSKLERCLQWSYKSIEHGDNNSKDRVSQLPKPGGGSLELEIGTKAMRNLRVSSLKMDAVEKH